MKHNKESAPSLDIRLESDPLVLDTSTTAQKDARLRGTIHIHNTDISTLRAVTVHIVGVSHIDRKSIQTARESIFNQTKREFFYRAQRLDLASVRTESGIQGPPFDIPIPTNLPETLQDSRSSYTSYELRIDIERGKLVGSRSRYIKEIRIVHRLPLDDDRQQPSADGICEDSIAYQISVPQRQCLMGAELLMSANLSAIVKGISFGSATISLHERLEIGSEGQAKVQNRLFTLYSTSTSQEQQEEGLNSSLSVSECLRLPSVSDCFQSSPTRDLRVSHELQLRTEYRDSASKQHCILVMLPLILYSSTEQEPTEREYTLLESLNCEEIDPPPAYGDYRMSMRLEDSVVEMYDSSSRSSIV